MNLLDRLFASLMFFTRLPWWRLREVPSEAFKHTVDFWPIVGWITGGSMALSFLLFVQVLPLNVALLMALATRLLLTGALHEDGLADFCDGMGGGTTRERTLAIMKDSHIGTYGVLGLIVYFALFYVSLTEMATTHCGAHLLQSSSFTFSCADDGFQIAPDSAMLLMTAAMLLFTDVYAKCIASFIIILPYARDEQASKAHVVYQSRSLRDTLRHLLRILLALSLPVAFLLYADVPFRVVPLLIPIVVFTLLMLWMKRKIGGYTGDCCGACFLICELVCWLSFLMPF